MPLVEKRFRVDIYAPDGTTPRASLWYGLPATSGEPYVKNEISFPSRINGGLGELELDLAYPWQRFDEGTTIAISNIVEVWCMDDAHTRGRRIYQGYISRYTPYLKPSGRGLKVTALGKWSMLTWAKYKDGSSYTVTHTAQDPEAILRAIVDHFTTVQGAGLITYSDATTDPVGTVVTKTFTDKSHGEAVIDGVNVAGTGWWTKVDADGLLWLKAKPTQPTHIFTIDYDIQEIEATKDGERIVNLIQVRGESGATTDVSDAASIAAYGTHEKIKSDSSLGDVTTRTQSGSKDLGDNKDPKVRAPFVVNANYDLESIEVGETCRIVNYDKSSTFFSDNMLIVGVTYNHGRTVSIELEQFGTSLGAELTRLIGSSEAYRSATDATGGGGGGATALSVVTKSANYTATGADDVILCNAAGGGFTITLPSAASMTSRTRPLIIKKIDTTDNVVTIDGNAGETVDGLTTYGLGVQYQGAELVSDGLNVHVV